MTMTLVMVLLTFAVAILCKGCPNSGTQHPRTTVALINDSANIICSDNDTAGLNLIALIINGIRIDVEKDKGKYLERGIEWESINQTSTGKHIGFSVLIQATRENNGTLFQCVFDPCVSEKGRLIVVESLPRPPDPPVAHILNSNAINVTWNPPWPYPVNQYTVFVVNIDTGTSANITTTNTSYTIAKENTTGCYQLQLAVSVDTDVGTTKQSNTTTIGYPLGISSVNSTVLRSSVTFVRNSVGKAELIVYIESFPVCEYEMLEYIFQISNLQTNETLSLTLLRKKEANFTIGLDDLIPLHGGLRIELEIKDEARFTLQFCSSITNYFTSTSQSASQGALYTAVSEYSYDVDVSLTNMSTSMVPTSTPTLSVPMFSTVYLVVIAVGGCVILLLLLVTLSCCFVCLGINKLRRQTPDQVEFALRNMVTNNHYAEADGIYETIPPLQILKQKYSLNPESDDKVHLQSVKSRDYQPADEYIEMSAIQLSCNSNSAAQ